MSSLNPFSGLFDSVKDDDLRALLVQAMLDETNLDSKTELKAPIKWALLQSINEYLEKKKLLQCNLMLSSFIKTSFKYLISLDRKGRAEYINAINALSANMKEVDQQGKGKNILGQ